jgi:hypothetical protein
MTSNVLPSPYVASASSEYNSTYYAYKAFDGNTTNEWASVGSPTYPQWLKIDLNVAKAVNRYSVCGASDGSSYSPRDWIFQGSNDNTGWNSLSTIVSQTSWGASETKTFACSDTTTAYRYFRLYISANNSGSSVEVSELYLLGDSSDSSTTYNCRPDNGVFEFMPSAAGKDMTVSYVYTKL